VKWQSEVANRWTALSSRGPENERHTRADQAAVPLQGEELNLIKAVKSPEVCETRIVLDDLHFNSDADMNALHRKPIRTSDDSFRGWVAQLTANAMNKAWRPESRMPGGTNRKP